MAFLLETKRLLIRAHKDSDLEPLFAYLNDPKVAKYQGWESRTRARGRSTGLPTRESR
jgi:RimJ/RimL family protein N-acetyltransferase